MISLSSSVRLSYCSQCQRPTIVADLIIKGWHHTLPICSECLSLLAIDLQKKTPPIEELTIK